MRAQRLPIRERGICCPQAIPLDQKRADDLVDVMKALADPTRLQMAAILKRASGPVCLCDLTATFGLSQPTISHHMSRLREAGLLDVGKQGVWSYFALRADLPAKTQALLDAIL